MISIPDMILALHRRLDEAALPHAFGGALALAWCTESPRGTSDIDLNVFVGNREVRRVLEALPTEVQWSATEEALIERDGQARLRWDTTPVDLFLNTTHFHAAAAARARDYEFAGAMVPFLSCSDLAVFKVFFNRTKDWADLEEMIAAGSLDPDWVLGTLVRLLGVDDERVARLLTLVPWTAPS